MRRSLQRVGLAALIGAATAASGQTTHPVDIPVSIPEGTQPVILEVHVGPLMAEAEVLVETVDGTFVGSVSTFGFKGIVPAGFPQIAVERTPDLAGEVHLTGKVVVNGVERPATPDELRGIRVVAY